MPSGARHFAQVREARLWRHNAVTNFPNITSIVAFSYRIGMHFAVRWISVALRHRSLIMRPMLPTKINWFALWRHRQTVLGLVTRVSRANDRQNQRALCNVYGATCDDLHRITQAAREIAEVKDDPLRKVPESLRNRS